MIVSDTIVGKQVNGCTLEKESLDETLFAFSYTGMIATFGRRRHHDKHRESNIAAEANRLRKEAHLSALLVPPETLRNGCEGNAVDSQRNADRAVYYLSLLLILSLLSSFYVLG